MASGPQSFTDGLQGLAADAMRLAALPDADPAFCMKIAQAVVAKARMPVHPSTGGGQPPQPAQPGAGGPPGVGPAGMPGGGPGGSPANGQMPTLGAPTMGAGPSQGLSPMNGSNGQSDEIRRMIAGAGQPG
jgi:hypothetical protein